MWMLTLLYMAKSIENWLKQRISVKCVIISVSILSIFFNEVLVYWIYSSKWPEFPQVNRDKELVVLLVSDPQVQGEEIQFGFPVDDVLRWDADRYLHKTFQLAYSYSNPDVVIFLGDLMDEGSLASHEEYERYFDRFNYIFQSAHKSKIIYIPGDNDIGGEGRDFRTRSKEFRYENYFEDINGVINTRLVDFLKLDVRLHSDVPLGTDDKLKEFRSNMTSSFRVILTHETMLPKLKVYIYPILREIQPQLILSGHWHKAMHFLCDSCVSDNADAGHWPVHVRYISHIKDYIYIDVTNNEGIQEIMVPTCSYRMGEANIGYGLAIMSKENTVRYTILWTPYRYAYLWGYLIIFICLLVFYIFTKTCFPFILSCFHNLYRLNIKYI